MELGVESSKWYATEFMVCDRQEKEEKMKKVTVKSSVRPDLPLGSFG